MNILEQAKKNAEISEWFKTMTATEKRKWSKEIFDEFLRVFEEETRNSPRKGQTQGFAFLWVSLYGKYAQDRAIISYVNKNGKLFKNYRGSKNAWYFGSQSDLGVYDGLVAAVSKVLTPAGISALVEDEWD